MDGRDMRNGSGKTLNDRIESLSEMVVETLMEETADILLSLGDSFLKNKGIDHITTKITDREEA